jgi:hypothetical protein
MRASRVFAVSREWLVRLWSTCRPARRDRDLEQELQFHLDLAREAADGAEGDRDASRRAAIRFGGIAQVSRVTGCVY